MSSETPLCSTAVFISPDERLFSGQLRQLPLHVHIVEPFQATVAQIKSLDKRLAAPFHRHNFDITGFEHEDRGVERVQRLGGSILHYLHDEVVDVLDKLDIKHSNTQWEEDSDQTWYTGTWHVPGRSTVISRLLLAQQIAGAESWQLVRMYDLSVPNYNYSQDDPGRREV